jgi:hypothetical protein
MPWSAEYPPKSSGYENPLPLKQIAPGTRASSPSSWRHWSRIKHMAAHKTWKSHNMSYAKEPLIQKGLLPDPFTSPNGTRVAHWFYSTGPNWPKIKARTGTPCNRNTLREARCRIPAKTGGGAACILYTWSEPASMACTERTVVQAICMDGYGQIAGWHLRQEMNAPVLESPDQNEQWMLQTHRDNTSIHIQQLRSSRAWSLRIEQGSWSLSRGEPEGRITGS